MFKSTDRSVRQYIERQQRSAMLEQEQAEKDKKERRKAGLTILWYYCSISSCSGCLHCTSES
ncbi:hypothetical protein sp82g_30 [Bacillus phage SP82G]|nr:hypothetical protein sp82g_30 [Bacillus phage SP82G]